VTSLSVIRTKKRNKTEATKSSFPLHSPPLITFIHTLSGISLCPSAC
jgi:hypothetical protein